MHSVWSWSTNDANRDEEVLTEINLNASEWRQKTEQFIEIIKTEVLEEKNIQIDVLKKFLVSINKIWWITKDKGGAGNFGISEKSKNFQQK